MRKYTFLAVVEPNGHGEYGVYFPDVLGCTSFGATFQEAYDNAHVALNLHIYEMEKDHDIIPKASPITELDKEDVEGNIIVPVTIYPDKYKYERDNRRVRTNCTIPLWVKEAGEEAHLNFSQLLENAVKENLNLR